MALIKELNSSYGVKPSYHRVLCVSLNATEKRVIISVGSYINKELRTNGYEPIDIIDIDVPKDDYPFFIEDNIISKAYQWLKVNVEGMEDAKDD